SSTLETAFQLLARTSLLACRQTDRASCVRSFSWQTGHPTWSCGHGGTRESRTSLSDQTWSVNPAAIAGVHGRHTFAEPRPLVASGTSNGWRRLAWGK